MPNTLLECLAQVLAPPLSPNSCCCALQEAVLVFREWTIRYQISLSLSLSLLTKQENKQANWQLCLCCTMGYFVLCEVTTEILLFSVGRRPKGEDSDHTHTRSHTRSHIHDHTITHTRSHTHMITHMISLFLSHTHTCTYTHWRESSPKTRNHQRAFSDPGCI